jgi:hypothetical protein
VLNANTVVVQRGGNGTRASGHVSGAGVLYGPAIAFVTKDPQGSCTNGQGLFLYSPVVNLTDGTSTQDYVLAAGANTINILPAIYGPGSQYQNVDALPADGAALTLWPGTTSPSGKSGTVALGLSRFAFALVGAKLYVPKAVEQSGQAQDPETGISVRKVLAWDPVRSMQINRMDSLIGMGNLYQDNGAVCVAGA